MIPFRQPLIGPGNRRDFEKTQQGLSRLMATDINSLPMPSQNPAQKPDGGSRYLLRNKSNVSNPATVAKADAATMLVKFSLC